MIEEEVIEIDDESLYCSRCGQLLGLDFDYGEKETELPSFVCCNKDCDKYLGGYFTKDEKRRLAKMVRLRSLGSKERVSHLEKNEVYEDWN